MTTRSPYATGLARRQTIISVALAAFALHGYRGAALRDIADGAGIRVPTLLHHFGSKADLLGAVLREASSGAVDWFEDERERTGSAMEALRSMVRRNMDTPDGMRLLITIAAEATDPEHPAHEHMQERYTRSREIYGRLLGEAQQAGEIGTTVTAAGLIAVLDGLQIQWLLDPRFDLLGELDAYLVAAGAQA